MGNQNTKKGKMQDYKMIEYPLKGVENDILSSDKLCTNFHKANHSNINISYSQQSDDIPTL